MGNTKTASDNSLEELEKMIRTLRSGIYQEHLDRIRDILCLSSSVTGRAEMEALLIVAANDCFKTQRMDRDIVLMSLSLLQEYDNCRGGWYKPGQYKKFLRERFENYLKKSEYIAKTYLQGQYASYDEAETAGVINKVYQALENKSARELNNLAGYLYDIEDITDYFEAAVKEFGCSGDEQIPRDRLPLQYEHIAKKNDVRMDLSGQRESRFDDGIMDAEVEAVSAGEQDSASPRGNVKNKQLEKCIYIAALAAIIIIAVELAIGLVTVLRHYPADNMPSREEGRPVIKSFSVVGPDTVSLTYGERYTVDVDVYPDEADKGTINSISHNTKVATADNLVITAQKVLEEEDNTALIELQGGESDSVYINVTVIPGGALRDGALEGGGIGSDGYAE